MRAFKIVPALAAIALLVSTGQALAQEDRTLTGKVTSITIDDPTYTRGLSKDERRYAVRVGVSGVPDSLVLGFGESGNPITPYLGMLDLLQSAMENGWTVQLRLNREVAGSGNMPSYARIVSVTVGP